MTRSPGTHATSGFHGSWMTLLSPGMARMSLSAGVMSRQVAKPAKPAPALAIVSIAVAGTILARTVPNRSTNEIRKYLTPCSFAYVASDIIPSLLDPKFACDPVLAGARGGESSCAFNHDHRMPIVREPQQSGLLANTSRRPGLCLPLEGGGRRV